MLSVSSCWRCLPGSDGRLTSKLAFGSALGEALNQSAESHSLRRPSAPFVPRRSFPPLLELSARVKHSIWITIRRNSGETSVRYVTVRALYFDLLVFWLHEFSVSDFFETGDIFDKIGLRQWLIVAALFTTLKLQAIGTRSAGTTSQLLTLRVESRNQRCTRLNLRSNCGLQRNAGSTARHRMAG